MAIIPTDEQRAVIEDDLVSQCIIACAGSGKTMSAVRRVAEIRQRMKQRKGYVALLSYSNVAVDTFRAEYLKLTKNRPDLSGRVVIATVDSFISTNILLPHGPNSMGCTCRPFLVNGGEAWLSRYTFNNGKYPASITEMDVSLKGNDFAYASKSSYGPSRDVAESVATPVIEKLGRVGGYTHALARYWALRTFIEQDRLVDILACRYPFILIDEAQDIGSMHGALVSVLQDAGVVLSLIGDPNQAIYEFADADGSFLRSFGKIAGVTERPLTENRRSVSEIVAVADALSSSACKHVRASPPRKHGAYYLTYKQSELEKLVDTFAAILIGHGYAENEAAILCRGNALADLIVGGAKQTGKGATEKFVQSAIYRDHRGDIAKAFECLVDGALKLFENPPDTLRSEMLGSDPATEARLLRRFLWQFLKNTDSGVPDSALRAKGEWHPRLKDRMPALFDAIESATSVRRSGTWKNNLTAANLDDGPLLQSDLISKGGVSIRTRTVHKVKGEGIDAVLYITRKGDLDSMLSGTSTEDGRIGYVAVTRAKELLIVAIPANTSPEVIRELQSRGLVAWS